MNHIKISVSVEQLKPGHPSSLKRIQPVIFSTASNSEPSSGLITCKSVSPSQWKEFEGTSFASLAGLNLGQAD